MTKTLTVDDRLGFARATGALVASVAIIASASAEGLPRFSTDPIPPEIYRQFRDSVIITGKCAAYEQADTLEEQQRALDACWLEFIAPRS